MIERIVLFKLTGPYANPEQRHAVAEHTRNVLSTVPGVRHLSVGVPVDDAAAKSWDLSIVVRFDTLDAFHEYRVHPTHREYVDDYMKPKMEVVKAWNFEVP